MITKLLIIGFSALCVIGLGIFFYEKKHAIEVDPKEPFLWDDYK